MPDSPALTAATEALAAEPGIGRTRAARLYAMKALGAAGPHIRAEERARSAAELEALREQVGALSDALAEREQANELLRAAASRLAVIDERTRP